jgi:hypothetical protein
MARSGTVRQAVGMGLIVIVAGLVMVSLFPTGASGSAVGTRATSAPAPASNTPSGSPPLGNNSTWTSLNVSNPPSPRWLAGITYDPSSRSVLLSGGTNGPAIPAQTWSLANSTWTNITTTSGPNPPFVAGMVYDPALGVVVAYGDVSGFSVTYEFSNGTWTNVTHAGGPPGRARTMMTYDVADSSVLLFGGDNGAGTVSLNDTWLFTAAGWTQVTTPQAPAPRARAMLTWDPRLDAAVLFGGFPNYGDPDFNDTWEFSHGAWSELTLPSAPSPRDGSMFVYDPNVGSIVLFGGFYTSADLSQGVDADTWYFNGTWIEVQPTLSPGARAMPAAVFDPDLNAIYFFGGYGFPTPLGDSWAWYENLSISPIASSVAPGEVGTPVQFNTSIFGGLAPYTVNWSFGDGTYGSDLVVAHAFATLGTFEVIVGVTDSTNFTAGWEISYSVQASPLLISPVTASVREAWPGLSVGFAVNVTDGETPYNLTWTFGDGGVAFGTTPTHTFENAGTAAVNVTVRDAAGATLQGTLSLPVAPAALSAGTPTVTGTVYAGGKADFNVTVTGGTTPYNLTWTFGDGAQGYGAAPAHLYATADTYVVHVTVRDLYGLEANASVTVTVASHSITPPVTNTTTTSSGVPPWVWLLVGIVLVAAISGVVMVYRRRQSPPTAAEPPGPES